MEEILAITPSGGGSDDDTVSFVKTLGESEFYLYEPLQAALGPAVNIARPAGYKYFNYQVGKKNIIVPSHPIGRESYLNVYAKGAVFGTTGTGIVPTGAAPVSQNMVITDRIGRQCKVRLMRGVPNDTWSAGYNNDTPDFSPVPEFDYFIHNLWKLGDDVKKRINFKDLSVPEEEKVAKLKYTAANSRSWALVKGHSGNYANVRARFDNTYPDTVTYPFNFTGFNNASAALTSGNGVWWPVFEVI